MSIFSSFLPKKKTAKESTYVVGSSQPFSPSDMWTSVGHNGRWKDSIPSGPWSGGSISTSAEELESSRMSRVANRLTKMAIGHPSTREGVYKYLTSDQHASHMPPVSDAALSTMRTEFKERILIGEKIEIEFTSISVFQEDANISPFSDDFPRIIIDVSLTSNYKIKTKLQSGAENESENGVDQTTLPESYYTKTPASSPFSFLEEDIRTHIYFSGEEAEKIQNSLELAYVTARVLGHEFDFTMKGPLIIGIEGECTVNLTEIQDLYRMEKKLLTRSESAFSPEFVPGVDSTDLTISTTGTTTNSPTTWINPTYKP